MQTRKQRFSKAGCVAALVLSLLIISVILYLTRKPGTEPLSKIGKKVRERVLPDIKQALEDKVKDMIVEASDSLYHVQYSKFKISIDSGYLQVKDLEILPDQKVLNKLIAEKRAPNNVFRIRVPVVSMRGIGFKKTGSGQRFSVTEIYAHSPSVSIINRLRSYNNDPSDPSNLYKAFRALFNRMYVARTRINNLDFKYINNNRDVVDHLKNVDLLITGFRSSPATNASGKGRTNLHLDYFRMRTPDRYYHIVVRNLDLIPANKSLIMGHASVIPLYSKARFHQVAGFAKDRYHWEFNQIVWTGIDVDQFIKTQQLFVGKQTIRSSWMEIYTNYNYALKEKPRRNAYPQEKFQTIAFDLTFKRTNILRGSILYRILAKETDSVSTLELTESSTTINNLTNNTSIKKRHPNTTVHSTMKVMNAGVMESWYTFSLKDKAGGFTSYSVLGPMNAKDFNILSRPLAKIEVRKGRINKLETYLKMNEYTGRGYVNFYYSDMKVAFLEQDKGKDTLDRKSFLSFVSNLVLPNDNPRKNGEFKKGLVNVKRENWQSFFKIQLDATLDGMSSAMMGVYQREKGADKNIILNTAKAIAGSNREDKETRNQERREEREKRREDRKKKKKNEN
ncbi:hypothetical protein [Desertivirga arenae]|uniref:hypothetical protein n=1 Tax=Desertivirga arenae TaxID=2810309 RepID=UPI001A95791C|nr:hypothetical protein [Pedobacter sp. SYSU D00823]